MGMVLPYTLYRQTSGCTQAFIGVTEVSGTKAFDIICNLNLVLEPQLQTYVFNK